MLRVEHLKAGPLPPLSFAVADGECLAVEGPSGAGKTCLLRAIADLDPAAGLVFLDGAERNEMDATQWRSLIRYVSAEPGWWTDTPRPAFEAARTADAGRSQERVERLITSLGLEAAMLDQPVRILSTGERQRLALARALLDEPRVLLLDEPTAGLDRASVALVEELLRYQLLAGRSLVIVSHDPAQIARLADARLQLARMSPSVAVGGQAQ